MSEINPLLHQVQFECEIPRLVCYDKRSDAPCRIDNTGTVYKDCLIEEWCEATKGWLAGQIIPSDISWDEDGVTVTI